MKRVVGLLFVCILVLTLCACGGEDNEKQSSTKQDETVKESEVIKEDVKETNFEEVVLVDNDACKITITKAEGDSKKGIELKALLENKTEATNLQFSIRAASIDGVNYEPFFAEEVAADKKSNRSIDFDARDFNKMGVDLDFSDLMMHFYVYNSNDWLAEPVVDEDFHIYPFGEDNKVTYKREITSTDQVLFDTDEVKVVVVSYDEEDLFGYAVKFYLENKTDHEVMFAIDDSSINGFMIESLFANTLPANTVSYDDATWFSSELEENDITEIEEIEFNFKAYDANDFLADHYIEETVVLRP